MMEKQILKAVEEAYRKGLQDAKGLNDISPFLLTSQIVAHEVANKFCQPLVSVSLLERAASLVGNPGTNISGSTDMACDEWQKDYERWRNER